MYLQDDTDEMLETKDVGNGSVESIACYSSNKKSNADVIMSEERRLRYPQSKEKVCVLMDEAVPEQGNRVGREKKQGKGMP